MDLMDMEEISCNNVNDNVAGTNVNVLKSTKSQDIKKLRNSKKRGKHSIILKECNCSMNCQNKVSRDQRQILHGSYWDKDFIQKKSFIRQYVQVTNIKRRTKKSNNLRRTKTMCYSLPNEEGIAQSVCQKFFLNTLGYNFSSSNMVYRALHPDSEEAICDKRGTYTRSMDVKNCVRAHIMEYQPTISHYCRTDAPNSLYLPSDLTVKDMFESFVYKYPNGCAYSFYCAQIKQLNISFASSGNEKCEDCASFYFHCQETNHSRLNLPNEDECETCDRWYSHIQGVEFTRREYKQNCEEGSSFPVVNEDSYIKLCRLCLRKPEGKPSWLNHQKIKDEFHEALSDVELEENDRLSQIVCRSCMSLIQTIRDFKQSIKRNQSFLLTLLQKPDLGQFVEVNVINPEIKEEFEDLYLDTSHSHEENIVSEQGDKFDKESNCEPSDSLSDEDLAITGYDCVRCNLNFRMKNDLTEHNRRMHFVEDHPFACSLCISARFVSEEILNRHVKLHEHAEAERDQQPFACSACELRFTRKSMLDTHAKRHENNELDSCQVCGGTLYWRSLSEHVDNHEPKYDEYEHMCSVCGERFSAEYKLVKHEKTHKLECDKCGKTLKRRFAFHVKRCRGSNKRFRPHLADP